MLEQKQTEMSFEKRFIVYYSSYRIIFQFSGNIEKGIRLVVLYSFKKKKSHLFSIFKRSLLTCEEKES